METYEKWRETDQRENGVLSRLVRVLSSATCPALSRQTPSQNFPAAATLNTLFSGKQTNKQICFQLWWSKKKKKKKWSGGLWEEYCSDPGGASEKRGRPRLSTLLYPESCPSLWLSHFRPLPSRSLLLRSSPQWWEWSGRQESFVSEWEPALDPRKSAPQNLRARGKMVTTLNTHCWTLSGWDMTVNISFKPCENPSGQVLLLLHFFVLKAGIISSLLQRGNWGSRELAILSKASTLGGDEPGWL